MRILICDDDPLAIEQINKNLEYFFTYKHIKCPEIISFTNGEALLKDTGDKNIVFLDIEMPGMNGIYVGNELKKSNPAVIIFIVTSYSEYLDEAMRFHVFRYLSKPLERQRFFRNMQDALNLYHTSTLLIPVETKNGVHAASATDIIAIEAADHKVFVYTTQKNYETVRNMTYWLDTLPKSYFFKHTGVLL